VVDDLDRLYEQVRLDKGKLDIVFANAAVAELEPIGQITEDSFERIYNVNVKGLIFTVQKALPLLVSGASVVLTGSGGAYKGLPLQSVYTSSKAAVRTLARSWIVELKERRIRVS
jgi:NAD(P)-dependent dehydrogenase (short-subunit alcohol dehydrogenase family)